MEFILQIFHRVQAAEGGGRFAEGFSPRKLAEALQVKRSFSTDAKETHYYKTANFTSIRDCSGEFAEASRKPRGSSAEAVPLICHPYRTNKHNRLV